MCNKLECKMRQQLQQRTKGRLKLIKFLKKRLGDFVWGSGFIIAIISYYHYFEIQIRWFVYNYK